MKFIWLFGLVCISAGAARSQNDIINFFPRGDARHIFCGKALADALSLVCQGRYNEYINTSKKDLQFADMSNDEYMYEQAAEELNWPFFSPKTAASMINNRGGYGHRRYRRHVADECCKKSCTLNDMKSYCGA